MKNTFLFFVLLLFSNTFFGRQNLETVIQTGQNVIHSVVFSANGKRMVSGSQNSKTVLLWNVQTGKQLRVFNIGKFIFDLAIAQNGKLLIIADSEGYLTHWNMLRGKLLKKKVNKYEKKRNWT